ncbi:MAG: cupin domain-containing protein [Hyphomicrobium sp.]
MPALTPADFIVEKEGADHPLGAQTTAWISEAGHLTQFGAFVETLAPGSHSSIKHWHSAEDEMVYVLAGEVTLIEGDTATVLRPGDAATFKAATPIGHCLENRSAQPTRCLIVGTRAAVDTITYPDHDRVCLRNRALPDDIWTDSAGNPAQSVYRDVSG